MGLRAPGGGVRLSCTAGTREPLPPLCVRVLSWPEPGVPTPPPQGSAQRDGPAVRFVLGCSSRARLLGSGGRSCGFELPSHGRRRFCSGEQPCGLDQPPPGRGQAQLGLVEESIESIPGVFDILLSGTLVVSLITISKSTTGWKAKGRNK